VLILRALRDAPADLAQLQRACGLAAGHDAPSGRRPREAPPRAPRPERAVLPGSRADRARACGLLRCSVSRTLARPISRRCATDAVRACSCSFATATRVGASCRCSRPTPSVWIVAEGSLLPLETAGRQGASCPGPATAAVARRAAVGRERRGSGEVGVASVSSAVRDASGGVVAAVSISGPVERLTRAPGGRFGAAVAAAAAAVAAHLSAATPSGA
jgi:hypothetical protein